VRPAKEARSGQELGGNGYGELCVDLNRVESPPSMPVDPAGLPEATTLRELEHRSRQQGSGLDRQALLGLWRVRHVWPKQGVQPSSLASTALRALTACLRITASEGGDLRLSNSIALGPWSLCFTGPGHLKGRRPLLLFSFTQAQVCCAGRPLLNLTLPTPAPGRQPFFALIASDRIPAGSRWLAARGRGGGLALWVREENGAP
jgi:hypothetical protein